MSFVTDNAEEYHTTWLVRFFHSFPHIDLSFEKTSANFTPESGTYREALEFWGGIPIIWCGILWLAFVIFFCARCCGKQQNKQGCAGCSRFWAGLFLVIGCGALAVTFYGNAEVHEGVGDFVGAVNSANRTIENSLNVLQDLDSMANDTETKALPALTQAIGGIANFTVRTKIGDILKQIGTKINSARTVTVSMKEDALKVDTEQITDTTNDVEHYRWTGTILVNCVYVAIFLFSFTALIKKSRWMLMLIAALTIIFMLAVWTMTSLYVAVGIAGGDLCTDPDSFVLSEVNGTLQEDVLQAYIKCDDKTKPYQEEIIDAQTSVTEAITALNLTVNMTLPFNISDKISGPVAHVRKNLKFMFGNLSSLITQVGSCSTIHEEYIRALKSVCYSAMEGVGYLVLFSILMGLASALLVFCSARLWPHLGKRRRRVQGQEYQRVDDSDPFLPDPPPYERNYGTMRTPLSTENRLQTDAIMINEEDRPIMNLAHDGESPPPAYQSGHYMQQYYSLAPTPSSVAQSTNTAT